MSSKLSQVFFFLKINISLATSITRERHVFQNDDESGMRNISSSVGRNRPHVSTRMHTVQVFNHGSLRRMANMRSLRNELESNYFLRYKVLKVHFLI